MIADIRLQHFRSYGDEPFEFSPGVNIVVGPNASGKTNLLESLLVICQGKSYRAQDSELICFDEPWARLDAHLVSGSERIIKLLAEPNKGKSYDIDGQPYRRLTLSHSLPVVLFEPNHLPLLSGGPENRRNYLDDLLEQTISGYTVLRRQYRRALAQRNTLLKQANFRPEQLFPWDVRLSQLAGQIVRYRYETVDNMQQQLPGLYKKLSHSPTNTSLIYQTRWPIDGYESLLLKKLAASVGQDRQRGFTSAGPHRDDLGVYFDGHLASEAASRGEARTLVLALKIFELQTIQAARQTTPLLLLDDVFSEIDGVRRKALTGYLKNHQTFITTTDADVVIQNFTESSHIIPLGR